MAKKSALIEETPEEVTITKSTSVEEVIEIIEETPVETEKPYQGHHSRDFRA